MHTATPALLVLALSARVIPPAPLTKDLGSSSESLKASQAAASVSAVHPGDADMSFDAIHVELGGLMNDPQYRSTMASMGARAADQKAKIDDAMAKHSSKSSADAAGTAQGTAADLEKIMPQFMRSQRLTILAQGKAFAFLAPIHNR